MKKFFDFTEALEWIKYGFRVARVGDDGKRRELYKDEDENFHYVVGEKKHDYILPSNEMLKATNWELVEDEE